MTRKLIPLFVFVVLCSLGIGLVLYSNSLPQNIGMFSKYSGAYEGNSNIVFIIGAATIAASFTFLLYGLFTLNFKIKRKPNPNDSKPN